MENILKDIGSIYHDLNTLISRAEDYRREADRGVNVNTTIDDTWTKNQKIESLLYYLTDAVQDFDRLKDDMKELREQLDNLVDEVEYERVRIKAVGGQ